MDTTVLAASDEATLAPAALAARLADERAADIVEALNEQTPEAAAGVLQHLSPEKAVEVLDQPGLDYASEIIAELPRERAVPLLAGMSADRVADVFRDLEDPSRSDLLQRLDPETKTSLEALLAYDPEDTAGGLMTTEFVSGPRTGRSKQALDTSAWSARPREEGDAHRLHDPRKGAR